MKTKSNLCCEAEQRMERNRHIMKNKCGYFTFVELIVVIICTCILILAWILFEMYVVDSREAGKAAFCASNLWFIDKACFQYSLNNDGRFPCARNVSDPQKGEWASQTDCCEDFELLRAQDFYDPLSVSDLFLCPDNEFGERAQKGVPMSNTGPKFNVTYAWYRCASPQDNPLATIACDGLTNHKDKDKRLFHPKEKSQFLRVDGSVAREPVDVFFRKEILHTANDLTVDFKK